MSRFASRSREGVTVVVLAIVMMLPVAMGAAQAQAPAKYTGAGSCGASNCHGSTKPKADYPKLNENISWLQKEKHAKAYETLTNERLKSGVKPSRIAKALNIAKAETSDRCLACHAVNVKPELRGPKFDIADGVHCDGCHGPAEKWLEPHAATGWTHEQSVKLGMYDTKSLLLRAEKCVSCHLQIDADMVNAGHPDLLAFELDTFSREMPPHWRDKGTWFGPRAWATGQVISLREAAKQVADRAKGNAPAKLVQDAAAKVRGHGVVVRQVFAVLAPDAQKALETDLAAVADLAAKGDRAGAGAAAGRLVVSMNQQAPRIAGRELDQATTKRLMVGVSGDSEAAASGLRGAEQVAMGLDRLYAAYSNAPGQKPNKAVSDVLDRLFGFIDDPTKFDPAKFTAGVKAFRQAVE